MWHIQNNDGIRGVALKRVALGCAGGGYGVWGLGFTVWSLGFGFWATLSHLVLRKGGATSWKPHRTAVMGEAMMGALRETPMIRDIHGVRV